MSQLALALLQPPQPTLENFVAGRNAAALDALRRLAGGRLPERIVYLWGETGCGRSHLAAALADLPDAWRWTPEVPPERPGLSVADDADRLDEAAQIALFNRLNAVRAQADAGCLITGGAAPARLALREDLRTRLAWGLVFQLHPLSDDDKRAALRAHAAGTGLALPDDVLDYLLVHLPRDLRTLVAALDALDAYALERKRPLTPALLRDWLQLRPEPPGG